MLQVLAVKLPQTFKRLYFTTRFYTFEPLKTVPATVMRREAIDRDDEAAVPLEVDPVPGVSVTATGVCVTFKVDTDAEEGGEDKARYFAQYLAARSLQIEAWDADAQLPVGSVQVDLRLLLRQGREAVQTAGEFSVTDSSLSLLLTTTAAALLLLLLLLPLPLPFGLGCAPRAGFAPLPPLSHTIAPSYAAPSCAQPQLKSA